MPSPGHRRLLSKVTSLNTVPSDKEAYLKWIEATQHMDLLRRDSQQRELVVYATSFHVFVHAVLVQNERLAGLAEDELLSWNGNAFSSAAGYSYLVPNGEVEIVRGFRGHGSPILEGATPLVFLRDSTGVTPDELSVEILQELIHVSALHRNRSGSDYQRRDENGDVQSLVSVTRKAKDADLSLVTMDRSILDEYMAVCDLSLIRMFDFVLCDISKFVRPRSQKPTRLQIGPYFAADKTLIAGHAGFIRGFQLLRTTVPPETVQRSIRRRFSGEPEGAVDFLVHDFRNGRLASISTDRSSTTNYFEQKEGLPFETSPAFFRPEVLQRYKSDGDKYVVESRIVRCGHTWDLRYGVNDANQVHAYICDLRLLPIQEQLYWKSFNVPPDGGLSSKVVETDFGGKFVDSEPLEKVTEILRAWRERDVPWWKLGDVTLLDRVNVPLTSGRDEWSREFLNLAKLLVDGFETNYLRETAGAMGLRDIGDLRGLQLLRKILSEGPVPQAARQNSWIPSIGAVQRIRSKTAAHRWGSEATRLADDAVETHDSLAAHFQHVCDGVVEELKAIEQALVRTATPTTRAESSDGAPTRDHPLKHGIPENLWSAAKKEARQEMVRVARCEDQIPYSDLADHICRTTGLCFEPHDRRFHEMLGEISTAEDAARRGMLSVVVVHKDGDGLPGPGFFKLASRLGRTWTSKLDFWIEESKQVYAVWSS